VFFTAPCQRTSAPPGFHIIAFQTNICGLRADIVENHSILDANARAQVLGQNGQVQTLAQTKMQPVSEVGVVGQKLTT
jgi:hypothetical protein